MRKMAAAIIVASLIAAGCGDAEQQDGPTIVATTTILGDIARNVAGPDATVEVILPIGADSHDFQPSSQQVALLNTADLLVSNGLGLEEGLIDAIEAAEADGVRVLEVGPSIDPMPFVDHNVDETHEEPLPTCDPSASHEEHEEEEEADGEHHHGGCDPHFWLDPLRDAEAARVIAQELATIDDSVDWMSRAESYAEELETLDGDIIGILDAVPAERRKLITNHEALGYFADRYDFEILGTVIPGGSTLGDPSSSDLARLVTLIRDEGVPAIFAETVEPSALADAMAAEAGEDIAVVELYTESLGEAGSGAATLVEMLRTNATRIAEALG
jgi:zinc/manganese transport system substrate-binding protein